MSVVLGTLAATAFAYSFQVVSFLDAKLFVLIVGAMLLALATLFSRSPLAVQKGMLYPLFIFSLAYPLSRQILAPSTVFFADPRTLLLDIGLFVFLAASSDLFGDEFARRKVVEALCWSAVLAGAVAVLQFGGLLNFLFPILPGAAPNYSVFGNPRLLGGYMGITFPLLLNRFLNTQKPSFASGAGLTILLLALILSGSRAAWAACVAGSVYILWTSPPRLKRVLYIAIVLTVCASICIWKEPEATVARAVNTFSPDDAGTHLRAWFWMGAWKMVQAHPLLGTGLGSYARVAPLFLGEVLWAPGGEQFAHNILLTEHPHSEFLWVWCEAGIIGLLLASWTLMSLIRCKGPEWGGLLALLVFALFNYPFQSPPHALAGLLLAACLYGRSGKIRTLASRGKKVSRGILAMLSIALTMASWQMAIWPSMLLRHAESAHVAGTPPLEQYERAVSVSFPAPEAYEKYGAALLDAAEYVRARDMFSAAIAQTDSGAAYLGLGAAEYKLGHYPAARAALNECVRRWPSHVNAWKLLARVTPAEEWPAQCALARRFLREADWRELAPPQRSTNG